MTMADKLILTTSDVLEMLDRLLEQREGEWWDKFFADRNKPCPFFVEWPDENLVEYSKVPEDARDIAGEQPVWEGVLLDGADETIADPRGAC